MDRRNQIATALGLGAVELSVLSIGLTIVAMTNPGRTAIAVMMASFVTAIVFLVYGLYLRRIGRDNGVIAFVAAAGWVAADVVWLTVLF